MSNYEEVIELTPLIHWSITSHLRFVKKPIPSTNAFELRLQQMWKGSDGSVKWEYVEIVETYGGNNEN